MATPETIGRYQVIAETGRGGMATVYKASDPHFGRDVAVKILPQQFTHDPTFRARFEREARTIANLEHPAIVPVYDFGEEGGQPYLVMRFMAGGSLADKMRQGPLPVEDVAEIIRRIGSALDYAHSKGIIHRDLKPGNILFDQHGNAFLSDFGIVKLAEATATFTGNAIVGTPSYMSPEQIHGNKSIDGRSDIYSLGVIAFEMLSGQVPYQADTPAKLMMKHILDPVPHIREVKRDLPPDYQTVIEKAMAKDRAHRFPTAKDLAQALSSAATQETPRPAPIQPSAPTMIEPPDATQVESPVAPVIPAPVFKPSAQPRSAQDGPKPVAQAPQPPSPEAGTSGIPRWVWALGCVVVLAFLAFVALGAVVVIQNLNEPAVVVHEVTATPNAIETLEARDNQRTATAEAADSQRTATAQVALALTDQAQEEATASARETSTAIARTTATARAEATGDARIMETATIEAIEEQALAGRNWSLFFDDAFTSDDDSWCTGDYEYDLLTATRAITDGQYRWDINALDDFVWVCVPVATTTSADFYVTVEGQLLSGATDAAYGVVFRRFDADNYYYFRVQNNGWYQVMVRFNDEWETLVPWTETDLVRSGSVNRLTVVGRGSDYVFLINDSYVDQINDDKLSGGRMGVGTSLFDNGDNGVFLFDNFELRTR